MDRWTDGRMDGWRPRKLFCIWSDKVQLDSVIHFMSASSSWSNLMLSFCIICVFGSDPVVLLAGVHGGIPLLSTAVL